ncbi:outer membrane protein assembly factor BamB family protein [Streptomyces olivochromogenes]|uniref:outer membrane protein assembly factor BamB family protein n=1 Tax=Streptomyces olivochromogenes TaxID=1963 RepID=UPI001F28564B|nr:PQQ-binding-like beta-propeller repeat protein [Streptomyces olivochromogenes]MCF3135313.1 PQQ-binding-like beta-propeller repeat protein [Streptomyces olivochromogenes]
MSFGPPPSVCTESALAADKTRTRRRTRVLGVTTAAVAVVLGLVAGSVWYLQDGRTTHKAAPAAVQAPDEIRTTVERPPVSPEGWIVVEHDEEKLSKNTEAKPRYAPGTWATGKILARGVANRIEGYKIEPKYDETAWTLKLDGHICATSRDVTADGRTAVVVQPARAKGSAKEGVCDEVVFFDVDTGEKLWQKKMPAADFAYVSNTNLTLTEGVVAVAWGRGSVAYDMKSGRRLWNSTTLSQCEDKGFAGGRALLVLVACGESTNATYRVEKLNTRTGKTQWTYRLARGVEGVYLPSSDPPVLAVEAGDSKVTDLITLDPASGKRRATISMDGYDPKCGRRYYFSPFFGVVDNCDGLVVGRTQAFVMSKENIANDQPSDWIVAFDLKKGKSAGKFDGRESQMVVPLRMSGDELLVYRRSGSSVDPAAVVSWNPRTDKETPYLLFQLPEDDEYELSDPERTEMVVEKGHVFFARRELVRDDKYPTDSVLSVIGVGSAGLKH